MTPAPIFATEKRMAELLDMDRQTFKRLVAAGALPGPVIIQRGKIKEERWDVEAMTAALRGERLYEPEPVW